MTNTDLCANVISKYTEGLAVDFEATPSDDGCFLLTPFYRPDGEGIELEVEILPGGNIKISDMGDTLGYLFVNGLTLSRTLIGRAKSISMGYGVSLQRDSLIIETEPANVGIALHELIQAALAVTDLIQMRRSTNTRKVRFDNEVESFIIYSGVIYDADYKVKGQREKHEFRFHVNSGQNLLIQPITASTESAAHTWAERWEYRFLDVMQSEDTWNIVAVLDDRSAQDIWTPYALAPIQKHAIPWAEKDRLAERLAGVP